MYEARRIEKDIRKVSFGLSNGEQINGAVFLSQYGAHRSEPENVGDLLRESDPLFPTKTDEGIILINRAQLVYVKLARKEEEDELMRLGTEIQSISVNTILGEAIKGEVCINLRQGLDRVKDYVNETRETFIRLFQAESIIYIRVC